MGTALLSPDCSAADLPADPPTSVVMGISGKPRELMDIPRCQELGVPVIRRFTGGGTVVITDEVYLVSFIMAK